MNVHPSHSRNQRDVRLSRTIDAPRDVVFEAWTDPDRMARWWGPKGFTNPVCESNARPGGALWIVMRSPQGTEHPVYGTFYEVDDPSRLVFLTIPEDDTGKPLLEAMTTVTFDSTQEGTTHLTVQTNAVGLAPGAA